MNSAFTDTRTELSPIVYSDEEFRRTLLLYDEIDDVTEAPVTCLALTEHLQYKVLGEVGSQIVIRDFVSKNIDIMSVDTAIDRNCRLCTGLAACHAVNFSTSW